MQDTAFIPEKNVTVKTSTTADVHQIIQYAFQTKYPKAPSPVWVKYTPVESDEHSIDRNQYYLKFNDRGTDIKS